MPETLPVDKVEFWRMRLVMAHVTGHGLHSAVYNTDPDTWNTIQNETAGILQRYVTPGMKILDAGCAYGPVFSLLPSNVSYLGIDISPHFIEIAKLLYPDGDFRVGDLSQLSEFRDNEFDLVICRSVKDMIVDNLGDSSWLAMKSELKRVGKRVLMLGYDLNGVEEGWL